MTFSTTMRASFCLALAGGLTLAGCGDSGTTDGGVDMGMPDGGGTDMGMGGDTGPMAMCPTTAPATGAPQMGSCCWRQNNGTQLTTPELRLAGLKITAPTGIISSLTVQHLLRDGFDAETFNWGIQFTGAPMTGNGDGMIKTGYTQRQMDGTFSFVNGTAPAAGGDPHRWDPVMAAAHWTGDSVTTDPYPGVITIPSFSSTDPTMLVVELPIYYLTLTSFPLTEMRSCVGSRGASAWNYDMTSGNISAYIRVDDAKMHSIVYGPINATLCAVVAGSLTVGTYCDMPQAMWMTQPDSLCTATGCTTNMTGMHDVCDPTMDAASGGCNAWHLVGQIDVQGVNIN